MTFIIALLLSLLCGTTYSFVMTPGWQKKSMDCIHPQIKKEPTIYSYALRAQAQEEEFHVRNPASTTPQLLSALWFQITEGCKLSRGVRSNFICSLLHSLFPLLSLSTSKHVVSFIWH